MVLLATFNINIRHTSFFETFITVKKSCATLYPMFGALTRKTVKISPIEIIFKT